MPSRRSTRKPTAASSAAASTSSTVPIVKKEVAPDPARVSPTPSSDSTAPVVRGENESYNDFVMRKRQRNADHMAALGLLDAVHSIKSTIHGETRVPVPFVPCSKLTRFCFAPFSR